MLLLLLLALLRLTGAQILRSLKQAIRRY